MKDFERQTLEDCLSQEEEDGDRFEKELDRLERGRMARNRSACPMPKDAVSEFKALGRLKGQDATPSHPTPLQCDPVASRSLRSR